MKRHIASSDCDDAEALPVGLHEAATALGNIGRDGESCTVELIGKKTAATRELLGGGADFVREIESFLVDQQFFELEGHLRSRRRD